MDDLTRPSRERLPSLDGLRAVAIALVVWSHVQHGENLLWNWMPEGAFGVRIFFVISGYIITRLLLLEEAGRGRVHLAQFYLRRGLRILPAFWFYLASIYGLSKLGWFAIGFRRDIVPALSFTMGLPMWHGAEWQVVHAWSLSIEEQFYLLWPAIFVLGGRRVRLGFASAVVLAGPAWRCRMYYHPKVHWDWSILAHGDMIAAGCVLAMAEFYRPEMVARIVTWRPLVGRLLALLVIKYSPAYFSQAFTRPLPGLSGNALVMTAHALAIAYLIASLVHVRRGISYRLLNLPPVMAVGLLSYGIYLWQQPFMHGGKRFEQCPLNLVCVATAVLFSYYCIERPMRALGRRRVSTRVVATVPAVPT